MSLWVRVAVGLGLIAVLMMVALYLLPRVKDRDSRSYRHLTRAASVLPLPKGLLQTNVEQESTIPGFAGWAWLNRAHVHAPSIEDDALVVRARTESVWWMNRRGPFLFRLQKGDFSVEGRISARMESNPVLPPDREWQFAGLMVRDPGGDRLLSLENYAFIVVGHRGQRLQVEYKSTRNGESDVSAVDWPTGDALLRITRRGAVICVYARDEAEHAWNRLARYVRYDLPEELQVGAVLYSFSEGRGDVDLRGVFRDLKLSAPDSRSATC